MIDQYDASETDERKRAGHISRRDVIFAGIVLVVLLVVIFPIYMSMMEDRSKHICKDHLKRISQAFVVYSEQNNDRLPPAFVTEPGGTAPLVAQGRAVTWITLLQPLIQDSADAFQCPNAEESELTRSEGAKGTTIKSSYGMYMPMSARAQNDIADPSGTVLISETSNQGARQTYDPKPLKNLAGEAVPDGFVIGLDNCNFEPDVQANVFRQSKFASRLSFYGSAGGDFPSTLRGRHGLSIHVVYPDQHIKTRASDIARLERMGGKSAEIIRAWSLR